MIDPSNQDAAYFKAIINFQCNNELESAICWYRSQKVGMVPMIDCSDFFAWGCSDAEVFQPEDIPEIQKAIDECNAREEFSGEEWGPRLWVARKRQMRPQGAFYEGSGYKGGGGIPISLRPLFNACGPHRPAELGNPYATPADEPVAA